MFSFLKKKYTLPTILPDNFVDIHNHLLPGIDDGAASLEHTSELVIRMQELGIKQAIATPHTFSGCWENSNETISKAFNTAISKVENSDFIKGYASEYMLDNTLIERLQSEPLLCLKEHYILVELSYFNAPFDLYELLFELKLKGYQIIFAHPERYNYFHTDFNHYEKLKNYDLDFQLNLLSLTGYYGPEVLKVARKLLDADMYSFSGTDIHHTRHTHAFGNMPLSFSNTTKLSDLLKKNEFFI
jgi:tyrosine-protein phosphatase YwqE